MIQLLLYSGSHAPENYRPSGPPYFRPGKKLRPSILTALGISLPASTSGSCLRRSDKACGCVIAHVEYPFFILSLILVLKKAENCSLLGSGVMPIEIKKSGKVLIWWMALMESARSLAEPLGGAPCLSNACHKS